MLLQTKFALISVAFPRHLTFLFVVFRKFLKPNRRFKMKIYSDVRDGLYCMSQINHEHRDNAVLDVTDSAVALGASQMAPIVQQNSIHRAMTHAGHTDKRLARGFFVCLFAWFKTGRGRRKK